MRVDRAAHRGYAHEVEIEGGHTAGHRRARVGRAAPTPAPAPPGSVAAALAACTAITCEMYAERKGWDLGDGRGRRRHRLRAGSTIERATVTLRVPEPLDDEQRERLLVIAGKCPVHRALSERDRRR